MKLRDKFKDLSTKQHNLSSLGIHVASNINSMDKIG